MKDIWFLLLISVIVVQLRLVGDSSGFVKKIVTTISGIASILKKSLKLTSWYC